MAQGETADPNPLEKMMAFEDIHFTESYELRLNAFMHETEMADFVLYLLRSGVINVELNSKH